METSVVATLERAGAIGPPKWLSGAMAYETLMGSVAYGVSHDLSDRDVYGFCVPPREMIFPHLTGEILGFGTPAPRFEQFQQHHVPDPTDPSTQWDITIFSIVKYFQLAMENNPNIIDSLFTPDPCVLTLSPVGAHVRANRRRFLHRGVWHKFKGYAYSQLHKMETKSPAAGSKRSATIEKFGFDVKFAYHVVRLVDEVEQILTTGDLDITRDRERLIAIRNGEWTAQQIRDFFADREKSLETAYETSALPYRPNEADIKALLMECLEMGEEVGVGR